MRILKSCFPMFSQWLCLKFRLYIARTILPDTPGSGSGNFCHYHLVESAIMHKKYRGNPHKDYILTLLAEVARSIFVVAILASR